MALFYYPNLSKNFLYSNSQGHPIQSKKKNIKNFFVQFVENLIARTRTREVGVVDMALYNIRARKREGGGVYGIVAVKKMKQLHGKSG